MGNKRMVIVSLALMLAGFLIIAVFFDEIAVYFVSKAYDVKIAYREFRPGFFAHSTFRDLKITRRPMGFSINGDYGWIEPRIRFGSIGGTFVLENVKFVQERNDIAYDTINGLVMAPFAGQWHYEKIKGFIEKIDGRLVLKDVSVIGDQMRLLVNGTIYDKGTVDADLTIYFSEKLAANIPEELSKVVLIEEASGWKSLSVSLSGDFKAPAIQLKGKLFRLNIRSLSDNR